MASMVLDESLFDAYLKCKTKFYLKLSGNKASDPEFSNYQQNCSGNYRAEVAKKLCQDFNKTDCFFGTPLLKDFTRNKYEFIVNCPLQSNGIKSHIHALEKINTRVSRRFTPYAPLRFIPTEKVTKQDKLILAFDGLAVSRYLGKEPLFGKIVHGGKHSIIKVRLTELIESANVVVDEILGQQLKSNPSAVILNKHCAECEFYSLCYKMAVDNDELSLLSSLSGKERTKLHKKGIFTVTQLSYTFRPRRRSKKDASKPIKHYHSLKALAIRDDKTYIAGKPKLDINGTPVYLDVEGIPDQNFYYLIGFRFKKHGNFSHKSLWADHFADEKIIWYDFLENLSHIENPKLIHYGSYEKRFLKQMKDRYGEGAALAGCWDSLATDSLNLLSMIYAQVYFPTYSNGLKDIAQHLGFKWSNKKASGINTLLWRHRWELMRSASLKQKIITYNAEDCRALQMVSERVIQLSNSCEQEKDDVVHTYSMKWESPYHLQRNKFVIPEFQYINQCGYWDYQRSKIYIKSSQQLKRVSRKGPRRRKRILPTNKVIDCPVRNACPQCTSVSIRMNLRSSRLIYDLKFNDFGVRRWLVKYNYSCYICNKCGKSFRYQKGTLTKSKYGPNLIAYTIYENIELRIPQTIIVEKFNKIFGFNFQHDLVSRLKARASIYYTQTYKELIREIVEGDLVHVDETKVSTKGRTGYVWVLTNLEEVVYIYNRTREGDMIQALLEGFSGTLVSDFYSAYDSIKCSQQKCLIHLIRDFNDDLYKEPFNEELRLLLHNFGLMLKKMIETVDRHGLKKYFLRKHLKQVQRFYNVLSKSCYENETTNKYKKRFMKYRDKLFTFLDNDNIPWNNNNAEHAIKAFVKLRKVIGGTSSEKGIYDYLVLLSICETCKYKGVSFLEFLRSGQTNIDEFVNTKHSTRS